MLVFRKMWNLFFIGLHLQQAMITFMGLPRAHSPPHSSFFVSFPLLSPSSCSYLNISMSIFFLRDLENKKQHYQSLIHIETFELLVENNY